MTLLRVTDVSLSFGSRTLFDGLELVIEEGERVGLVGVNGSGKSTLMQIISGSLKPDTGTRQIQRNARVIYLPQEPEFREGATIASELEVAQAPLKQALAEHQQLSETLDGSDERALARLSALSEQIERLGGWDTAFEARTLLDRLGVKDWDRKVSELSGGQRKRVAIARSLLARPDLLLLDEPTNHLDAETTEWLEAELDRMGGSLLLVTHDRYFLDGLVDRIVELERGQITSYPGNYEVYLEQKLTSQENAATAEHKRQRWIAQEVAWLRRGPQARRTKSKARIERAHKLLAERGFVRPKTPELQLASAPRLSQTVIEAKGVSKSFGSREIFHDVNLIVQPGERLGFVGPNGVGKTTLLRTLLGELQPDAGTVKIGPRTKVAYYDQQRTQLDPDQTVLEAAWHEEWVELNGKKVRLSDYLDDLLFPVPMQRMKVKALSGGERNRLLLARLFLEGANVLVLDEPTNDLDLVTLNVLERLLVEFTGAVLLVTHDRYFLDKAATAIISFDHGSVTRYEGNWDMYRRLKPAGGAAPAEKEKEKKVEAPSPPPPAPAPAAPAKKANRLSYKDQHELDGMEAKIQKAEAKKAELEAQLADPKTFSNSTEVARLSGELEKQTRDVEYLYARWQQLTE